jgi:putative peptide maturation system protein
VTAAGGDALILEVVAALRALSRSSAAPAEAAAQLRALAGPRVELIHERDAAGDRHELGAVVELPDGAAVVRYCPDRGAPFILRGAERLGDRDLVQVDGEVMSVSEAIALLDFIWHERPVMRRLLDACVLQAALRAEPVELRDDQVQAALDAIRAANGLYTAEATRRWMVERGITHEALEARAADQAAIRALRDRVVGGAVAGHFAAHRAEYDAATLARVAVPDDPEHRARVEHAVARGMELTELLGLAIAAGYVPSADAPVVARVRRRDLTGALGTAVFDPAAGRLRVVREPPRITVVHVFAVHPAELDDATAELIAAELFDDWLAHRRGQARIEWNWGTVERTRGVSGPQAHRGA